MNKKTLLQLLPVLVAFFVMGFVDLVGIGSNYLQKDFQLSDVAANFLPSMVFVWFFVGAVPTGMLMNKIGRRKTALISLALTLSAMVVPWVDYSFSGMIVSFSLLGIGNTLLQVSLNPLVSNIVSAEKLASVMTFGQFVKAIASFLAPVLAAYAAARLGDWRYLFLAFSAVAAVSFVWLWRTPIQEEEMTGRASTFKQCFSLLGDRMILLFFIGIVCHVGIDVGINITAPRLLMERAGRTLAEAGFAASVYFLFRTAGCLAGAFLLTRVAAFKLFWASVVCVAGGIAGLFFAASVPAVYACLALIGLGNANIFPVIFSQALLAKPEKKNEVSGLLIMGLFGGTLFPLLMGALSDALSSQAGAVLVLAAGVVYLGSLAQVLRARARI